MAYLWRSYTTFSRLDIGPGKMVSLEMVKGGSEIVKAVQVPSCVQVIKVNWAKHNFVSCPHLVICGKIRYACLLLDWVSADNTWQIVAAHSAYIHSYL